MKVILTEKVSALGNVGEIVNVSPGYGRNYLIPNNLAVMADESNKAQLANNQRALAKKIEGQKKEAVALKEKLNGLELQLSKKVGGSGKLFGTVTNSELAQLLADKGLEVERRLIHIANPIKGLGLFNIKAKLFADVEAEFKLRVILDEKQAQEMKERDELAKKKGGKKGKKGDKIELMSENPEAEKEEVVNEEQTAEEIKEFEVNE